MNAQTPRPVSSPAGTPSQRLSPHFSLAEMTHSATAARRGLKNTPPPAVIEVLTRTAERMEEVRKALGDKPISVLSGYRSPAVNKAVGGSPTSAHMTGHAIDFICPGYGTPAQVVAQLRASPRMGGFDQIIEEFGEWIHIGFGPGQRGQVLSARRSGGRTVYVPFGTGQ
ncbi:DUF882 domain-containing protein [Brevundimonas vitis]|uniref:DUF882 domain-containing protein n=1 Tax=Brevundimonas vitisensis TaxID=2800818 RepID=A0ABX7BQ24_9CAUL|nr:D-Ala-D-Ala carboxypeptidase family metallohydrolase [Brevundimonas vitisensis]QQQ19692.1 DUF882 domain-containing protein [Brevundimonas vitisensis]